jgi:hypothetical protein
MIRFLAKAAFICLFALTAGAQVTNPIRYTWIATACDTWNCAAAALVMAAGSPGVLVLPTKDETSPWIVLRRVEEGSLYVPDTEPFACEVFEDLTAASPRFNAIDSCRAPLIVNVPDGRVVIASLTKCGDASNKRRAAR